MLAQHFFRLKHIEVRYFNFKANNNILLKLKGLKNECCFCSCNNQTIPTLIPQVKKNTLIITAIGLLVMKLFSFISINSKKKNCEPKARD